VTASEAGENVLVRPAEQADLLAVFRIERRTFPQPWPYAAFERYLDAPAFFVAVSDGVIGYVIADCVPNHGQAFGHVKDLAVRAERRGEGVGTALLSRALSELAAVGAESVKLEVREGNDPARSLYEGFGFEYLKRVPGYYADGEAALVLVRSVAGAADDGPDAEF
jgi:ribosomal-protein-alanine N-acetyltransferase